MTVYPNELHCILVQLTAHYLGQNIKGRLIMQKPIKLVHRSTINPSVLRWIQSIHCWHLDTWLHADDYGRAFVLARTGTGHGRELGQQWFSIAPDALSILHLVACSAPIASTEIQLHGRHGRDILPASQDVFWRLIAPLADLWPRGTFKRRSIAHHMIAPTHVVEPTEGILNYYASTGRELRDIQHASKLLQRNIK